jgi:hypothetical protein
MRAPWAYLLVVAFLVSCETRSPAGAGTAGTGGPGGSGSGGTGNGSSAGTSGSEAGAAGGTAGATCATCAGNRSAVPEALRADDGGVVPCAFAIRFPCDGGLVSTTFMTVLIDAVALPHDVTETNGWEFTDASHAAFRVFGPKCAALSSAAPPAICVRFDMGAAP